MGHLMCRDILVNFTSYYRCPYRMGLARKVLLESKFVRYSHFESPVYVLWLERWTEGIFVLCMDCVGDLSIRRESRVLNKI